MPVIFNIYMSIDFSRLSCYMLENTIFNINSKRKQTRIGHKERYTEMLWLAKIKKELDTMSL